ncbi:MAG: hypothetical protein HN350_11215 [Phycisphaerales bacterium]|jgi:hypothetical protein|nr:hypothetical protein [Phycisphaerales bacterium]
MPQSTNPETILQIDKSTFIGKGRHRECYVHPEDPDKCVKIIVLGDQTETQREQAYYRRLDRRKISWSMLSRYCGDVQTNMGPGAVFELVRDYNGEVSKPMTNYLPAADEPDADIDTLLNAITTLKKYMLDQKIVTMTLQTKNILYQRTSPTDGKLVIVDGIGNSDYIPICNYVGFMATIKIKRRWKRFEAFLLKNYGHNQTLRRMLENNHT